MFNQLTTRPARPPKEDCMSIRLLGKTAFIIALAFASSAFAQKKIVVPKDFPSIQKAVDEANENDTVFVLNGVYKERIVLKDRVHLIGQDVEKTILRGNRSKTVIEGANFATIKNFTIENGGTGIICKNTNPIIDHNIVRSNAKTGIHCLISLPSITNNLIYANEWSGIYCELVTNIQRTAIDHNIIAENGYCGIMLANRSEVLIQNNILYQNKQFGVYVNEDSKRSRIVYNDFFNNRTPFNSYAVINETNIAKDPGLSVVGFTSFTGLFGKESLLKGMGKSGVDIGVISDESMNKATDKDNDGVPDYKDQCSDMPEDKDGFKDEDGCPDFDNDNDGIYDAQDQCPDEAEDFDGFEDQDGCLDIDNDKDGISDKLDKCPNTAEDVNGVADDDGCPDGGKAEKK
jgi:OmpA-OmpF porin, OOP family